MKRYFLLLFLLHIGSSHAFNNLKNVFSKIIPDGDQFMFGVCAIPLIVDLGFKINANNDTSKTK